MSATIHYRQTSKVDPYLKTCSAPSSFIESIEDAFHHFPCELEESDIGTLRGMASVYNSLEEDNPYKELIDLIEKFGSIKIYASY